MTINERVKAVRKALKLTQKDFGQQICIAQTYLSQIENGDREVTDKIAQLIALQFNVSENWLHTGQGEMFASSHYEEEFMEIFESLTPDSQDFLINTARQLLKNQEKLLSANDVTKSDKVSDNLDKKD